MLVYGDHSERVATRVRLERIAAQLAAPFLTHDQLTAAFIDLAGVTQGVADADFAAAGRDRPRAPERALLASLTELAGKLLHSWDAGRAGSTGMDLPLPTDLPDQVEVRMPEGYAFYALYPEAYGLAARKLTLRGEPRIIGVRSIGTGLACMAAAALGAPHPVTLRPAGDPFARTVHIAPELETALLNGDAHFIIVDEGPGLSGSSFGAVADWLEDYGVSGERIAFLPGHGAPLGAQASTRHKERWASAQRPVVTLDMPPVNALEQLIGPSRAPLQDVSGGAWRSLWSASEAEWPAIDPIWERRKFLAQTGAGKWLVKFAGLGRIGEAKLQLARTLHGNGFGPEAAGLAGGWLVTRWHCDARQARPTVNELIAYLRLRSTLPALQSGASLAELLVMTRRNVPALREWSPDISNVSAQPVCTDNRLAEHEWLRLPSGQLLKADALDHHAAHDLIGCQPIEWDIAGAIAELDLSSAEAAELAAALDADPRLLDFYSVAYRAFRVGAHRLSAQSLGHWPEEQARNLAAAERFERELAAVDAVQQSRDIAEVRGLRVEPLA